MVSDCSAWGRGGGAWTCPASLVSPYPAAVLLRADCCCPRLFTPHFPRLQCLPSPLPRGPCRAVNKLCLSVGLASLPSLGRRGGSWLQHRVSGWFTQLPVCRTAAGQGGAGYRGRRVSQQQHRRGAAQTPAPRGRLSLSPATWSPSHTPWA